MKQPLHTLGHVIERDEFTVERILERRTHARDADDSPDVEQCSRDTRDSNELATGDHVVSIDSSTPMNDHPVHDRTCAVRNEDVHSFVEHLAQTPLLSGRREGENRRRITRASGDLHLFASKRPGRREEHAG